MTLTAGDWAGATIQHQPSGGPDSTARFAGCLVQMSPACDLRGPRELQASVTSIGRADDCEIVLNDGSISRRHAEIVRGESGYEIRDLRSTNGTYVNDKLVANARLRAGDLIRVGNHLLKFLVADDMEAQYHETVFSMMTRDGLTGTLNKRFLIEVVERDVARCGRSGVPLSLLLFDIDRFKLINDKHGHLVGDEVLRQTARRVQDVLQDGDLFARYGGEEFVIALVQIERSDAALLAERIRAAIADHSFNTRAGQLDVTISIGVAVLAEVEVCDLDSLIQLADERLYEAKGRGRNQVCAQSTSPNTLPRTHNAS